MAAALSLAAALLATGAAQLTTAWTALWAASSWVAASYLPIGSLVDGGIAVGRLVAGRCVAGFLWIGTFQIVFCTHSCLGD